jgi:DNA replication protein DnaC
MMRGTDAFRENWCNTRLRLKRHHLAIKKMENAVWEFCVGFINNPARGRRLLIYGNNGTGKTKIAKAVCHWVDERSHSIPLVHVGDSGRLVESIFAFWPKVVDDFKQYGNWDISEFADTDMLVLDDIGAEYDPSRVGTEKLFRILEHRAHKWTIVTTNVLPSAWEERFERRIADRLFRNFTHIDLTQVPSYSINT